MLDKDFSYLNIEIFDGKNFMVKVDLISQNLGEEIYICENCRMFGKK